MSCPENPLRDGAGSGLWTRDQRREMDRTNLWSVAGFMFIFYFFTFYFSRCFFLFFFFDVDEKQTGTFGVHWFYVVLLVVLLIVRKKNPKFQIL